MEIMWYTASMDVVRAAYVCGDDRLEPPAEDGRFRAVRSTCDPAADSAARIPRSPDVHTRCH